MQELAARITRFNRAVGLGVAWLTLAMVVITALIVVQRYWFDSGSIRLQESVTVMHALVFMLAAAYTLAEGGHVRVDVFYSRMSARQQAWVNLLGTALLLMPFCGYLLWSSGDYVATSWQIREASQEAGGLPYPFPALVKSCIPLAAGLLLLQGCAMLLESIVTLRRSDR
ncbi:MAG: TRAP transporter small permease subunit [Gammaproteobacteria bacterium]|jgi:TRAP-type mannitol/chloroaromatic compound transport system permease small subunit|nr:TRAP transporter small permease subunit [Gammaproteobacteria bacterium]